MHPLYKILQGNAGKICVLLRYILMNINDLGAMNCLIKVGRNIRWVETRAGTGAEKRHRVLALSQPARIRVTATFSIYH